MSRSSQKAPAFVGAFLCAFAAIFFSFGAGSPSAFSGMIQS